MSHMTSSNSLWVKRAKIETSRRVKWNEALNRVLPLPFEERRARIGMLTYRVWRWWRYLGLIIPPILLWGVMMETRETPHENMFTSLHVWLADQGFWRHSTIKALNPAYENERLAFDARMNDRRYRTTGADQFSQKEMREWSAINIARAREGEPKVQVNGNNIYGL